MEAQQSRRQETRRMSSDSDLEHLSMVDIDAAMTMSVTDAVFSSVLPHYPVGAHIQCRCKVADEGDLADSCWIGLFKVGWASAESDCVCRAECRREGDRTLVAVFTQTQLPRDTHDFYQFCFVAPDGLVKGASSPFLFRGAPSDDFVAEMDEELQGVVVSAKTAQLQCTLANMRLEHEAQRSAAEIEAEQLRSRLAAIKLELRAALDSRASLEGRVAEAESAAGRLRAEVDGRQAELQRMVEEVHQSAAARLISAEDERQRLLQRLEEAAREAEAANNQAEAARKTLEMHAEERQRQCERADLHRAEAEELAERLRRAELQLADAGEREKRQVERMAERMAQVEAAAEAAEAALELERAARQQAESEADQLRSDLSARQQLEAAAVSASGELRAQQARYASLLTAYEGVKRQFHMADERERVVRLKYDEVITCNRQMLQREERLHSRLADLQARLKEGACEYKKLMKKYRELQQQQQHQQLLQSASADAAEPDEFHDAQADVQNLNDYDAVEPAEIHRPPALDAQVCPPAASAAAASAAAVAAPGSERFCPVCSISGFAAQRDFEEHVHGHFSE